MPAGISHLILARQSLDYLSPESSLTVKKLLARHLGPFLVGTVAPDIGYMGNLSGNPLTNNKELADALHYKKTNELPLLGLQHAKTVFLNGDKKLAEALFAFYMGYSSHLIADGVVHPFVRDYVGDYDVAATEHRILEMKLDILMAHKFLNVEVNGVGLQKNLQWIEDSPYKFNIYESFAKLIKEIHDQEILAEKIDSLVKALTLALDFAGNDFPRWYTLLASKEGFNYSYLKDIIDRQEEITTLHLPKDANEKGLETNFMGTAFVNFFDHVVPHFFKIFPIRIEESYKFVFKNGPTVETLIPLINLDTGRPLSATDLKQKPTLWA